MTDVDPFLAVFQETGRHLGNGTAPDDEPDLTAASAVVIEPLRDFLQRPLPKAEALVGVVRDGTNLLPRYGWVMPWGREGSGKTSVLVDLLFHAAAGRRWLHYPVARPLRIVAIINEGVPGGLQDKLAQKAELWQGDTGPVLDNLAVYASPWGEFTFKNTRIADHARDYARDFGADYIALDPLHTMGTTGAGTPEETETFKHTLREYGLWADIGYITAHHSNKSGMVSGDWGRHADTILHLEKDGKRPATKLTLTKARPADPHELGVPQLLEWVTETMGYRLVALDAPEIVSDDEMFERIFTALDEAGEALTMTELKAAVTGQQARIAALAKTLVDCGRLRNRSLQKGRFLLEPVEAYKGEIEGLEKRENGTRLAHDAEEAYKAYSDPEDAQTRMAEPNPVGHDPKPTDAENQQLPVGGPAVGLPPVPPIGGQEAYGGPRADPHWLDDEPGPADDEPTVEPEP